MANSTTKDLPKHNRITAVVLAAGLSKRMGDQNKLLILIDNEPMIRRTVGMLCQCGLQEVVVVLGYEHEKVRQVLEGLNVRYVFNADYEQGQVTSVQCGLDAVTESSEGAMICLADQPALGEPDIANLIEGFYQLTDKDIVIPLYQSQRGNPIIISTAARQRVLNNGENMGCRCYIDSHPESVQWMEVDSPAFITDLDTQIEYRSFCDKKTPLNE